jgi:hypothetical protein
MIDVVDPKGLFRAGLQEKEILFVGCTLKEGLHRKVILARHYLYAVRYQ